MKNGINKSLLLKTKVCFQFTFIQIFFYWMKFYVFNTFRDEVGVNYTFSLGLLNSERKPSVKKTGRLGVDFEFYRSGRENCDRFHLGGGYLLQPSF